MHCHLQGLTKHGLDYEVVDLSRDEQALRTVTAMGHLQAPVVVDGDESWSGFRPDLIKQAAVRSAAGRASPCASSTSPPPP
ncbi:NrdH-redoxin [Luteococcus japonicus]|uniref:NrdH-redoxin n=1 Tax=Luteococcus japonicus TaxID=33984 RepID=UPI00277B5280|nr:NrdH-redoxin [Luteococcus japonicus]